MRADAIADILPHLTKEERAELDKLLAQDTAIWRPLPGPQSEAFHCQADVLGYGGAAGGGKSDLISGLTLHHSRSVIFRREKAQTERVVQRLTELLNTSDGYSSQKGQWKLPAGGLIEFGGLDNPMDHTRWQGRDHDLKAYDEATEMREFQVRWTMGWNRSADPSIRSRSILTFNPPATAEGRWIIPFFGPWLDPLHPDPALPGELRWVTTVANKDMWVPDSRPFVLIGTRRIYNYDPSEHKPEEIITPKSRTFIPSRVTDNPYYMATGYISTLQSMPEPYRSQLLNGDFKAGMRDDEWQVIPTAWIDAAMARWTARVEKPPMDSMGSDPARGGEDNHVIARRHGTWYDELIVYPGPETPDGPTGASQVVAARRDQAVVHIDIIGWGSSVYDFLQTNGVQTVAINASNTSYEVAKESKLRFANMRAELVWKMREALDPNNPTPLYLPPDTILRADLAAYKWKLVAKGIQIRDKAEMKVDLGRSPDRGDAVCYALRATVKNDVMAALKGQVAYDPYAELNR